MFVRYDPETDTVQVGNYNYDGEFLVDPRVTLRTHPRHDCARQWCVIHNPNPAWDFGPLFWRSDRAIMERICQHGVGHPAREEWDRWVEWYDITRARTEWSHGCDGCCVGIED